MNPSVRRSAHQPRRRGMAMLIVLVLIGLFAVLCQALTMLVAIQHQQSFHHADQAQLHRLADAGLRRAVARLEAQPGWESESWTPSLPTGEAVVVQLRRSNQAGRTVIRSEAMLTNSRGRTLKANQTLVLAAVTAAASTESSLP